MSTAHDPAVSARHLEGVDLNREAFRYYRRLARVERFVCRNHAAKITLADVARVAGMQRSSFSDFFHRKTGVCFSEWLAAIRVNRAKVLMASGNVTIRAAGSAVGLRNVRTFERTFRRVAGQTPIEFKKSVRPS